MYRLLWPRLVAFVLLAVCLCCSVSANASAETIEILPAPEVAPKDIYVHEDGAVTVVNNNCTSYPKETKENAFVTVSSKGTTLSAVPRQEGEWQTHSCVDEMVSGFNGTSYVVQTGTTFKTYNYPYRVIADRSGSRLWTASFADPFGCSSRLASIRSMTLGQDGNLYVVAYWPYGSKACPAQEALFSLDAATGAVRFTKILPNVDTVGLSSLNEVMAYENGIAVLDGNEVFYFDFEGEGEAEKDFVAVPSETTPMEVKIVPGTGRIYWWDQIYNPKTSKYEKTLYYRALEGATNEKVVLSGEKVLIGIAVTPSSGVVAEWKEGETKGFTYFDEAGSVVYQQVLSTETGATVQDAGLPYGLVVDDLGNVIVRRQIRQSSGDEDRNIVVDSFSPEGTKTRLFNSASIGTNGVKDYFTSTSRLTESMSQRHVHLMLCHVESTLSEGCDSTKNPVILSVSSSSIGFYDYPHAAVFAAGAAKLSYVALGDSYSAGQGVPSFIPPSDGDGCHRSYDAYPPYIVGHLSPSLRLDAFVACSGAETIEVEGGMNGESPQLKSVNSDTDVISITIGGNDIGFSTFATRCVLPAGSCDSSSAEYEESMEKIATILPERLENLYEAIRSHAENAEIYVVGYPQVTPEPGVECAFLVSSEEEAAREVITSLNQAIENAVENAGEGFIYVNPNNGESPFAGHELCREESYFNGVELPQVEYSFHPNKRGQQAYAELLYLSL